jgi:thymidine kinase
MKHHKGKVTVIFGPMFSGKTGKLVAMIEVFTSMGFKVLTLKPNIDMRYSTDPEIHSHDHRKSQAITIDHESANTIVELIKKHKANKVIIDEAQFFDKEKIITVVHQLINEGIDVFAAGLLYDFKRKPFGAMPDLIGLADEQLELVAVCQKCGSIARHSERLTRNNRTIDVGAADKYIAVCQTCHEIHLN